MFLRCVGDQRKLLADCDLLIAFQITQKELFESNDKVHSTTPESTPVKNIKVVRSSPGHSLTRSRMKVSLNLRQRGESLFNPKLDTGLKMIAVH